MKGPLSETEMRESLAEGFAAYGLTGRGNFWRLSGAETNWVIHLDRQPYGNSFGLELGLNLSGGKKRLPLKDCEVILYADKLPLGKDMEPYRVLELDEQRGGTSADEVKALARAVAENVLAATTLTAVREKYQRGEFRSSFVTKEGREILSR